MRSTNSKATNPIGVLINHAGIINPIQVRLTNEVTLSPS